MTGPGSAVNNNVALFNGTSGKIVKDSGLAYNWTALPGKPSTFAPSNHVSKHRKGGVDPLALDKLADPTGDVNMANQKLVNVKDPTNPQDAVTKKYLEDHPSTYTPPSANAQSAILDTATNPFVRTSALPAPYTLPSANSLSTTLDGATDPFVRTSDLPTGGGTGDVVGPAGSANNVPAIFDGTTGKLLKAGASPLGNAAYKNVGVTPGTVAAGDDPRFGLLPEPEVKHLLPYARKTGQGVYDLEYVYGLNWRNAVFRLNELYQLADAQAKFPKLFQWYLAAGKNNTWIMNMRHYPACHNEAVLQGHTQGNIGSGRIDSRNFVSVGPGHYLCNHEAIIDGGKYNGTTSSGTYQGGNGTVLIMDTANWQGNTSQRFLHRPSTLDATSIWGSYMENLDVRDFRYEGLCNWLNHDPSYMAAGLGIFYAGENATVDRIFSTGFNGYGIVNIAATPIDFGHLSCFGNTFGGFGHLGGALSTTHISMLSGDDNPALFRTDNIVIQEGVTDLIAGGGIRIDTIKSETGKRDPQRAQQIAIIDGHSGTFQNNGADINLSIGVAQFDSAAKYAGGAGVLDALFTVNGFSSSPNGNRSTSTSARVGRVSVDSLQAAGYRTVLQDIGRKQGWASDGDYVKFGFKWNARLASPSLAMWTPPCDLPAPLTPRTMNATGRMGVVASGGSFNYGAGTPAYDETNLLPINIPSSSFQVIYAAVNRCTMTVGQTAQCTAMSLDYELRTMVGAPASWNIVSGPATINASTGLLTSTGTGDVVIRVSGAGGVGYCYTKVV